MTHADRAGRYARDVVAGRVLACRFVRSACQRHLDDLAASKADPSFPFVWSPPAANAPCEFIELMPHVKGRWASQKELLVLEDWQCFMVAVPFGWLRREDGLRRYRKVYIEVPRKNAKSTITAALGLFMLTEEGEFGAEVYSGAGTEKQAYEVFGPAKLMAKNTPAFLQHYGVHVGAKNIHVQARNAKFEPIIGQPGDGASPSFAIIDEFHEHPTSAQLDTMVTGMGARDQPMAWVITTAGASIEGPCYDLRNDLVRVLDGSVENNELFGMVYTLDEEDPWDSVESLRKANPNIDVSVREDYLVAQLREAVHNPRKQAVFRNKHQNVWTGAAAPYFNLERWRGLADTSLRAADFIGESCVIGVDLAAKIDLAVSVRLFQREQPGTCSKCRGEGFYLEEGEEVECGRCEATGEAVEAHFYPFLTSYLPGVRLEAEENAHYRAWHANGWLTVTPGNITDYDEIEMDLVRATELHRILELGFDPHNATQLITHLMNHGIPCVEVPQTVVHLSEPMKEVQALIEDGRIHHDGNPIMTWGIGNVTAKEDRNQNVFPRKEKPENKIDPAVALIIAMGRAMSQPAVSVYEDRGVRVL